MKVKAGTVRLPDPTDPAVIAQIEKIKEANRAKDSVQYVIEQVHQHLRGRQIPRPAFIKGVMWAATGLWKVDRLRIEGGNSLIINLSLIWTDGKVKSANPLGKPGIPKGFGPGFRMPRRFEIVTELTRMPTSGFGFAQGVAPGIPKKHHAMIRRLVQEELKKLEWIEKGE